MTNVDNLYYPDKCNYNVHVCKLESIVYLLVENISGTYLQYYNM